MADAERALSAAAAEGLRLVKANNVIGYRGVSAARHGTFQVRARKQGVDYAVGTFLSAEEAALAYARFIGAEESQKQAGRFMGIREDSTNFGFGMPRPEIVRHAAAAMVECEAVSDEDTLGTATAVVYVRGGTASTSGNANGSISISDTANDSTGGDNLGSSQPCELSSSSPPQTSALRRKRAIHEEMITEEYELKPADDAITLPVPSAFRGRACNLTIVYKVARS